eukprot:7638870-Pyramimonas_sp.AAC.1
MRCKRPREGPALGNINIYCDPVAPEAPRAPRQPLMRPRRAPRWARDAPAWPPWSPNRPPMSHPWASKLHLKGP